MSQSLSPRQLLRMAAAAVVILIVVLIVFLVLIQSRHGNEAGIAAPLRSGKADALVSDWTRCRTVTLDQTVSLETCRRLWAENRRQFFTPTKASSSAAEPLPTSATALGKIQDRVSPDAAERRDGEVR
jgi:conjugative transfer region protein TrbK